MFSPLNLLVCVTFVGYYYYFNYGTLALSNNLTVVQYIGRGRYRVRAVGDTVSQKFLVLMRS